MPERMGQKRNAEKERADTCENSDQKSRRRHVNIVYREYAHYCFYIVRKQKKDNGGGRHESSDETSSGRIVTCEKEVNRKDDNDEKHDFRYGLKDHIICLYF